MSDLLSIASSGLQAIQKALDTTSHNISNVNTPGYSRQLDVFATRPSVKEGAGFVGTGVSVQGTRRIIDQFTIDSLRNQTSTNSELNELASLLEEIDALLSDPETGVADGMNQFFLSLQDLNNNPGSIPARQLFVSQANVMAQRFNDTYLQLQNKIAGADQKIRFITEEINSLAKSIAEVNVQIGLNASTGIGSLPNDLLDQRDKLLTDLSKYTSTIVTNADDGTISVFVGNGLPLVISGTSSEIITQSNPLDASRVDIALKTPFSTQVITSNINGGEIGALLTLRDASLSKAINSMGRLALTLAGTINDQHQLGIDLNGQAGGLLFSDINSTDALRSRSTANAANSGNAILNVAINTIDNQAEPPFDVFTADSNIINTSAVNPLLGGMLSLNGISIPAAALTDDTLSSAGQLGSAVAIANKINTLSAQHGVTATAEPNALYLGQFTAGAFAAGEFAINGVNIVTTGANEATLLQDINALSTQTGVRAVGDGSLNITLIAADGRNIQLTSNTNTPVATFTHFDTNSAVALDSIQTSSIKLTSNDEISISGTNLNSIGFSAGTTPTPNTGLTLDDYSLSYDGTFYTLRRIADDAIVVQSSTPNINVEGMSISIESGTMVVGDVFSITPTRNGAIEISAVIRNPEDVALAYPVSAEASLSNTGSGAISVTNIINTSGVPISTPTVLGNAFQTPGQLTPPIRIEFVDTSTYRVFDISNGVPGNQIGPDQSYSASSTHTEIFPISGVTNTTAPGPNNTYVYDPGYRVTIQGSPQAGDVFSLGFNQDASGDNRNSIELLDIQLKKLMNNGNATLQEGFAQTVSEVASQTNQVRINAESSDSFLKALESKRNNISGVNLEEEAANLLKFEQSYQAVAQLFSIARDIFDTLIGAFSR